MSDTDPGFVLQLVLDLLPTLVGLVGLCLIALFPRPRGTAVTGLVLLTLGPLSGVFLYRALSPILASAGSYNALILLSYSGRILIVAGLLLLALAATRGSRSHGSQTGVGHRTRRPAEHTTWPVGEHHPRQTRPAGIPSAHPPNGGRL